MTSLNVGSWSHRDGRCCSGCHGIGYVGRIMYLGVFAESNGAVFFVIWEDARHDCFAADMWNDRILLWGGVDPEYSEFDDVHLEYCWDYFEEPCRYDASDSFFNYSDRAFRPWYMLSSRCTVQDGLEF